MPESLRKLVNVDSIEVMSEFSFCLNYPKGSHSVHDDFCCFLNKSKTSDRDLQASDLFILFK